MKLISMTDFVLSDEIDVLDENNFIKVCEYAKFLKQPLKLEMFVPCDDDGSVLENPICQVELEQYRKAKEKVLFNAFDDVEAINYHISRNRNIEYLSKFGSIELTKNATKQFL